MPSSEAVLTGRKSGSQGRNANCIDERRSPKNAAGTLIIAANLIAGDYPLAGAELPFGSCLLGLPRKETAAHENISYSFQKENAPLQSFPGVWLQFGPVLRFYVKDSARWRKQVAFATDQCIIHVCQPENLGRLVANTDSG